MAETQSFRSALNGFNRQDVVNYIEFVNNKHKTEVERLKAQLRTAKETVVAPAEDAGLRKQLDEALAKCAALEKTVAELQRKQTAPDAPAASPRADELEAYRRAERAERLAQERARQIQTQANAALADAALRVDEVSAQIDGITDQLEAQLEQYQSALRDAKNVFRDAADALYAIRARDNG